MSKGCPLYEEIKLRKEEKSRAEGPQIQEALS
jgi:hypothetical protein